MNEHQRQGGRNQNRPVTFSRRTLLHLGAAGLISLAFAPAVGAARSAIRSTSERAKLPVAIGYAPFADDGEDTKVIDADSLSSGQSHFHQTGAIVKMNGFCTDNAETRTAHIEKLSIDVSFEPFHDAVFRAWSFQNAAASSSCPTAIRVPVDANHGLNLHLTVQQKADGPVQELPLRLALTGTDQPKLREGRYFVGLPGRDGAVPEWAGYVVKNDPDTREASRLTLAGRTADLSGPVFVFSVGTAG